VSLIAENTMFCAHAVLWEADEFPNTTGVTVGKEHRQPWSALDLVQKECIMTDS
jgi:hypothetical protein